MHLAPSTACQCNFAMPKASFSYFYVQLFLPPPLLFPSCPSKTLSSFLISSCNLCLFSVKPAVAVWTAQWPDFVTSLPVSVSAVREHSVSAVTDASRVTGASRAADPASVTGMQTSATRGPAPASAAEIILEGTSVRGDDTVLVCLESCGWDHQQWFYSKV